ncbi:hypothetical protein L6452_24632 [Arctium lappa]|uniref:Uncharacterized protein n=1 Tax=Arctium lappa TaxID=4217 RepID=A0ACB9A937_ARCLA|nr:hypothetical protein L6452_24632 [Arctium lappa]
MLHASTNMARPSAHRQICTNTTSISSQPRMFGSCRSEALPKLKPYPIPPPLFSFFPTGPSLPRASMKLLWFVEKYHLSRFKIVIILHRLETFRDLLRASLRQSSSVQHSNTTNTDQSTTRLRTAAAVQPSPTIGDPIAENVVVQEATAHLAVLDLWLGSIFDQTIWKNSGNLKNLAHKQEVLQSTITSLRGSRESMLEQATTSLMFPISAFPKYPRKEYENI